ncbi:putative lipopolysaccharide heptosyltransferase III [Xenorhabdus bovienii]|uniref:Lipopolysaccharide heptosyltransferase 3 n=1 Tax=Xenorhabdus bovienii str. Intermedium TaxID=1379677 RepID=A0A077QH92_XENBV|nr:putative lipopolysaccharide heptosyltransferase III [Xenorhabdus bovienii]MDE9433304.1 putative lipopolysaccharide heptosyltransferase III [Xenorhabdus bovienii]MDE9444663.1 putative lipopolysaccharide heptosyltransferase III [Xenorhabdus bovienii]MDE9490993.1 putative lipopolysaccharide heptosyltransferase III [Xenorhabdus bovienii]MDE9507311.1 putative lipopolysaccharide heptosyltransferase III [Xenorhabdus bovienii]MDE9547811.1 putative lipopolysaccharide heptosyltransferase III [Xenorha
MGKITPRFEKILIIKLRHHGDMLLITPVVNTLKENFPDAEVDVLLYKETKPMLMNFASIAHIFPIDKQWKKEGAKAYVAHHWRLLKQLRNRKYDLVINLADQWYSALVSQLTSAPARIGFDFPKRQNLIWKACFTDLVSTEGEENLHVVEQNLSALKPLNLSDINIDVTMSYSEEDRQKVSDLLHSSGINEKYIVIHPASRWFFKCWDEDKISETINALQADGHAIVLTSGTEAREKEMVAKILFACSQENIVSLAGQITLPQLGALIDHAKLFIGVDSVPMHMAAALKTPCIALFGPSKLVFWRPWNANGEVIWAGNYGKLPDPDGIDTKTDIRYLDLIPVNVVIETARRYL